jgi:hypothetical protein
MILKIHYDGISFYKWNSFAVFLKHTSILPCMVAFGSLKMREALQPSVGINCWKQNTEVMENIWGFISISSLAQLDTSNQSSEKRCT